MPHLVTISETTEYPSCSLFIYITSTPLVSISAADLLSTSTLAASGNLKTNELSVFSGNNENITLGQPPVVPLNDDSHIIIIFSIVLEPDHVWVLCF